MRTGIVLTDRATSGFPLSIGTGLAMESLFTPTGPVYDESRKVPAKVNLSNYDSIWINLSTLLRNIIASVDTLQRKTIKPEDLFSTILEEIDVIVGLGQQSGSHCEVKFYHSTHSELSRKAKLNQYGAIRLRTAKTEAQIFTQTLHFKILKAINDLHGQHAWIDGPLETKHRTNSIVMTHFPYDLLGYKTFSQLDLLESNTGVLKPRTQWNTKYYPVPGADMSVLPYCRKLLLVFGDKPLLLPFPIKFRQTILDIAKARQWTALTTDDRVRNSVEMGLSNPYDTMVWKSL